MKPHRLRTPVLAGLLVAAASCLAQPVARVTVYANGGIELDGRRISAAELDAGLRQHAARSGVVWYHRERPTAEPHPNADIVVQSIIRHRLPVSLSTRPDFSDYVDAGGVSRPRR